MSRDLNQNTYFDIECEVIWENKSEYFISIDNKNEMWVPKNLVGYNQKVGRYTVILPEQLAVEKGLV